MITPRRITLFRVPDLAAFRSTLTAWIADDEAVSARDTCIVLPTRAAAEQLRRTVEARVLSNSDRGLIWPVMATRRELYDALAARLAAPPRPLSPFEREVLIGALARALVEDGLAAPFEVRPGLVAEMLALYDQIRRLGRQVADFERNFTAELEREADTDRGAARLLQQTVFLAAAYRGYEVRLAESDRTDEHALRERLAREAPARPLRRVVVTVGDHLADSDGLWPADVDLLTRLPGLQRIDILSTESQLAAGYLERLHAALPDFEEARPVDGTRNSPVLVVPAPASSADKETVVFSYRDREDELAAVARRLKQEHAAGIAPPLHRTALVVRRPLPYLYLARDVFQDAGIAFETPDTLPLAAEPYAAAVDLVLDAVSSDFTRSSLLALLRSPHFTLADATDTSAQDRDSAAPAATAPHSFDASIAAFDFALAEARYLGTLDRLQSLVTRWGALGAPASREERRRQTALPAANAVLAAAQMLQPLAASRAMTSQISTLLDWLRRFDAPDVASDATSMRRLRVRGAVFGALTALRAAYEQHDPSAGGDAAVLTAALRRWLGGQTFAVSIGEPGLQVVDAQAAKYGDFDSVQVVGLIEGEWPERVRRNVLYPSSLLALLEPLPAIADPSRRERDALQAARAAFKDLVLSSAREVRLSAFALENDAVVEPSILADEVAAYGLTTRRAAPLTTRVAFSEALALEPRRADVILAPAADWAARRLAADGRIPESLRGDAGEWRLPRVSISRLELYLNCPFKFFAGQVLKLEEQPDDGDTQTPLERGLFLHELWERFFTAWQDRGHGRIDPEHVEEARALFAELCEQALTKLPSSEAALERYKLLGSAVSPGIAHRVFTMEASRPAAIVERLLEYPLEGVFEFQTRDGATRSVALKAKTDRIDVLQGGAIRVIDYKSKYTPDPKIALQLPLYAHLARGLLAATRSGSWSLAEALYVSFEGDKAVVPLRPARGETLDDVIAGAQDRMVRALNDIEAGRFPPRPAKKSLCNSCSFSAVCRLEIQAADESAPDDAAGESVVNARGAGEAAAAGKGADE